MSKHVYGRQSFNKRGDRDRPRKMSEPEIPEGITARDISGAVRQQLGPLSREHAEAVATHLAAAGALLDTHPDEAYLHARYAVESAGRIAATREALGLVAYRLGKYEEALKELRTHRRITGANENLPVIADCERGRDKPNKALEIFAETSKKDLDPNTWIELVMVVAGAHMDLDNLPAAKALVEAQGFTGHPAGATVRLLSFYADILRSSGETQLGDKYEELARRTAARTNVLFEDEQIDPNASVQILTVEEEPEEEPDEPEQPEPTSEPTPEVDVDVDPEEEVDEILAAAGVELEK